MVELIYKHLSFAIIGVAMEVYNILGSGFLEAVHQTALEKELMLRGIPFERELPLLVEYKGIRVACGYRLDLLVARSVVVEVKSVDAIAPVDEAQLLTYLRLGGWKVGLLINFGSKSLEFKRVHNNKLLKSSNPEIK